MARDYSNRGNSSRSKSRTKSANGKRNTGGRKRSQPAKKRSAPKKNTRKQAATPGWVWLGSGLCIGLTVAAVVYITTRPTSDPGRDAAAQQALPVPSSEAQESASAADNKDPQAAADKQDDKPRFAFYEMLPDYKVVIPEENYPGKTPTRNTTSASSNRTSSNKNKSQSTSKPSQPQPTTPTVDKPGHYIIQAGSFSTPKDANRRKAELTLLGLQAQVIKYTLDSGTTVYRVRSQTIDSNSQLNKLLKRLRENSIATIVLRQSD